jgi:hypothetical protein
MFMASLGTTITGITGITRQRDPQDPDSRLRTRDREPERESAR